MSERKKYKLSPKSDNEAVKKTTYLNPLLPLSNPKKREWRNTRWQRPMSGANEDKRYDWYVQVEVRDKLGRVTQKPILHLDFSFPEEARDPERFREKYQEAISRFVDPAKGGSVHLSKKTPVAGIGEITILRRFRHRRGYLPPPGVKPPSKRRKRKR